MPKSLNVRELTNLQVFFWPRYSVLSTSFSHKQALRLGEINGPQGYWELDFVLVEL